MTQADDKGSWIMDTIYQYLYRQVEGEGTGHNRLFISECLNIWNIHIYPADRNYTADA